MEHQATGDPLTTAIGGAFSEPERTKIEITYCVILKQKIMEDSLKELLSDLKERIIKLEERVDELETSVGKLEGQVEDLENLPATEFPRGGAL